MEKLNVKATAVGLGVLCAAYILILGWASVFGWGTKLVEVMSSIYIGFKPGFLGGIIGAVWGFIDGAVGGAILALVYNYIADRK